MYLSHLYCVYIYIQHVVTIRLVPRTSLAHPHRSVRLPDHQAIVILRRSRCAGADAAGKNQGILRFVMSPSKQQKSSYIYIQIHYIEIDDRYLIYCHIILSFSNTHVPLIKMATEPTRETLLIHHGFAAAPDHPTWPNRSHRRRRTRT